MSFPCPALLFVELMRVNELRMRRALLRQDRGRVAYLANDGHLKMNNKPISPLEATLAQRQREGAEHEAVALLIRIMDFQVAEWAAKKDADRGRCGAWIRLGNMYKSAMVLFAILSLSMSPDEAGSHGSGPVPRPGATHCQQQHMASTPTYWLLKLSVPSTSLDTFGCRCAGRPLSSAFRRPRIRQPPAASYHVASSD